jgi:hypothetical protein
VAGLETQLLVNPWWPSTELRGAVYRWFLKQLTDSFGRLAPQWLTLFQKTKLDFFGYR